MGRSFTHYWTSDTWEGYRGEEVTYTAANLFRKRGLKSGDRIYIVSNFAGRVRLGSAIDVEVVVGRAEAKRRFGREVWDGSDFAIARKPASFDPDREVPPRIATQLRFLPSGKGLEYRADKLDQQTLRGLRELTPESAELLEACLRGKSDRPLAGTVDEKYPWRYDPGLAGKKLREILSGVPAADAEKCVGLLRRDIALAEAVGPDRWSLNLHEGYVRLIGGTVLCLQLGPRDNATLLVEKTRTPPRFLKEYGEYAFAPGCAEIHLSIGKLLRESVAFNDAHQAAIRICIDAHGGSGAHRRARSPGLVEYLREGTRRPGETPGLDQELVAELRDLAETEREALLKYRCAQGLFRDRVAALEGRCRVTGISDPSLLRASHIKPWRLSDSKDRQDGNNGLFLAPHVDVLFDGGWISFTDAGDLLVSSRLDPEILKAWGISYPRNVGKFRPEQRSFLEWHRKEYGFQESQ